MATTSDLQSRAGAGRTVMEERAPVFSAAQAEGIARRAFEIRASAHPLASERDQNFHLRAEDGSEWVLKIANPAEDPAILDMQTRALLHIARVDPTLPVPRVRATREGDLFHEAEADDGRRSIVRLVSFLPGELLNDAAPHPALARDVGAMAARLARALRGFSHPASRHALLWDLTQAPQLRSRTHHIENPRRRRIVEEVLDRFAADVLLRLQQQRAQVIHNDVSRTNTLVEGHRVNGVIDFGDMIHAPLVSDLAVPISELLVDHPAPIAAAAEITAGYHAVTPLTDEELRLIFDLGATRCAMSVAVAYWRVRGHPENTAYIMAGVEGTATLLDQMREWGAERMVAALRRACAVPVRGDASRAGTRQSSRGRGRRSRG
jgi:Ser/Thr protein kinase RdoA (MazF antagonist)